MFKILTPLFALAALAGTQAAIAAPVAKPTPTPAAKPMMAKPMAAKPMAAPAKPAAPTVAKPKAKVATTGGRMVTTKTSTGKTITYDCSKAGNATKKACK